MRDPRLLDELERDSAPVVDWSSAGRETLPTALPKIEPPPSSYAPQHVGQHRDHSLIYRKFFHIHCFIHAYMKTKSR